MGISITESRVENLPLPTAYKGSRGEILLALKRHGALAARDLGERIGLSANAIRHHLRELEAEGVIGYRREQRGLGPPTYAWHLTPAGEALFPQRYKELLTEVLDRVAEQSGRQAVVSALETRFTDLAARLGGELAGAPPAERLDAVMRALVEGGYMAEWHDGEDGIRLTEHHCAIRALAERFPEICAAEARFLEEVLSAAVERESHMLAGCSVCEYSVRFPTEGPPLTGLTRLPTGGEETS
jgi:DeoR family suf operon transcriptional repressor